MSYTAPLSETKFLLNNVLNYGQVAATDRFADANDETCQAILSEAAKLTSDVLAPLNRSGDLHPAHLENGVVRCSPGYDAGYKAIADGGWVGISADPEFGGMGLPMTMLTAVGEMMSSACLSLSLNPLMTQGQIEALEKHGDAHLQDVYLPKLISGQWTGTMNLTEPQAGSDVGALRSKAIDNGDGTFSVSGQKIFISWGDHDIAENICHLVLARLPDGVQGTKGISLFMVPKLIPDQDGNPGVANSLKVVSLEHKLGLHGSPTVVMSFDGAKGWIVGEPNGGMAAMFTMMNMARLGVGVQGLGVAEAALQKATAFALERKQGRSPIEGGTGTILDHADVRRMVMHMKAMTAATRAICLDTAISIDMATATGDVAWKVRADFLTPIAKAMGTDVGSEVADLGVQVHGGMGYIEETGASQYLRDVRVTRIYEGTNGIQAMDLVGRKLMDGGQAGRDLLAQVAETANGHPSLLLATDAVQTAISALLEMDMTHRSAGATAFLRAFGLTLGGHYLIKTATSEGSSVTSKAIAEFYSNRILPEVPGLCAVAAVGCDDLYALNADDFIE